MSRRFQKQNVYPRKQMLMAQINVRQKLRNAVVFPLEIQETVKHPFLMYFVFEIIMQNDGTEMWTE